MPNVLVRDVPTATLAALKRRARQHGRSLQHELALVLDRAAREVDQASAEEIAAAIRARLAQPGRVFTDSTGLIRADRER